MAILAGIDEAGYGPTLGPLVVTGVAFRVPDELLGANLWKCLKSTCTASPAKKGRKLAVADSKKLYHGDITLLERAALVMLGVAGRRPNTLSEMLEALGCGATDQILSYPWYERIDLPVPISSAVGDVGTRANAVRRNCAEQSIEFLGGFTEFLLEGHFNRLVHNTRNKAAVNLSLALRVAERVRRLGRGERVCLRVDRMGGREHYRESLADSWPGYALRIEEESERRSAYRLEGGGEVIEIEFLVGGESRHLPIALASVYSKYVREVFMHLFNGYWTRHAADLIPTAGYSTDARRWLKDAGPVLDRLKVDRGQLVRAR